MTGRDRRAIPVLCYHSISDEPYAGTLRWSVSPADFDEQMALLAERGRTSLTVSHYAALLVGRARMPRDPVLVTLDDGYPDLATTALPVLLRYGIRATAYVITGRLGRPAGRTRRGGTPALDWDALMEVRRSGVEIGSHSHRHRPLDCLGRAELLAEATVSKRVLEDGLGGAVRSFAYPYGYHSDPVRRAVLLADYTSACAVKNALSHAGDDVFAIARVLVERDTGLAGIDALLSGRGRPLARHRERLRTRGWRTYRRTWQAVSAGRWLDPHGKEPEA
jgi:peptidoglycan/xylan/chitin deacetylase (PgdA/CDA1 family)